MWQQVVARAWRCPTPQRHKRTLSVIRMPNSENLCSGGTSTTKLARFAKTSVWGPLAIGQCSATAAAASSAYASPHDTATKLA